MTVLERTGRTSGVPRRRSIKGVLRGFLGSFTSRYSDYDGYWVFGMLVEELTETTIDLLATTDGAVDVPLAAAVARARVTFSQQIGKVGLDISKVREAGLDLRRSSTQSEGLVNGRMSAGYDILLVARAVSDLGTVYVSTVSIFAAPHDAKIELRSTRGGR